MGISESKRFQLFCHFSICKYLSKFLYFVKTKKIMSAEEASKNEAMDTSITEGASDEDDRKLFVGGLPQDAKDPEIREYFGTFGEIDTITLKTDQTTGRSRGFAFVVFKTVEGVDAAVDEPKTHFSQFGTIANIEQPFDKAKNERKNFCFITFEKEDVAKRLLKEGTVYINGHELEIKRVNTKPDPRQMMGGYGPPMRGGRGGWGGPQQGWGGPQWGGQGGYGGYEAYGGYGGYGDYGGWGGQGGYGGGYGGYGGQAGGKTPRGGAARGGFNRGRGGPQRGGPRTRPY